MGITKRKRASVPVYISPNQLTLGGFQTPFDATACPQDIAYPTDLNLLSDAREKSEQLIDILYDPVLHKKKPRTYRKIARKRYLQTAQKKNKIRARLKDTSESWIACIFLVLNLVKLTGMALSCLIFKMLKSFSAKELVESMIQYSEEIYYKMILHIAPLNPQTVGVNIVCRV